MENKISVLIVEDEGVVALGLENMLQLEGYEVAGTADSGKEAIKIIKKQVVDLVLLDIQIKGEWDGVETARRLTDVRDIPFIYLTAFSDEETVERARETFPAAYLTKPYQARSLMIAIDLALHNFAFRKSIDGKIIPLRTDEQSSGGPQPLSQRLPVRQSADNRSDGKLPLSPSPVQERRESILYFNDAVFFKQNYKYVKVTLADILYLEADGNYTNVHTDDSRHVIRYTLNTLLEKLDQPGFVRVHRSYAINFQHITTFNDHTVYIGNKELSLGRHYKEDFFRRFDFL